LRNSEPALDSFQLILSPVAHHPVSKTEGGSKKKLTFANILAELDSLREDAKAEGREIGYQEGFAYGTKKGLKEGNDEGHAIWQEQIKQDLIALDEFAGEIRSAINRWLEMAEVSIAPLAVEIAEKILQKELELSDDAVTGIAKECFRSINHATTARVIVNTANYAILKKLQTELMMLAPSLRSIEFLEDPTLPDGLVIDTDAGRIEGTTEARIINLREDLKDSA
jgi:flagellar biosynthesis/type III secretory pathway protein FliH